MKMKVAGWQMPVGNDVGVNTDLICTGIERAADAGADILLTPEGSLSGYHHIFNVGNVQKGLDTVTAFAQIKGVGLALGTCYIETDGVCYNQIRFYTPEGVYLGFHTKMLRCGTMTDPPEGEINHYGATPLRTFQWKRGIQIGGLICNDLWANPGCTPMPDPHLSQQLADLGVNIIFHAVNGGRNGSGWSEVAWRYHEANLRMRARAGRVWVVTVDNCAPVKIPCSAPSGVVSPDGEWVVRTTPQGPQFFVTTIEE
ncbi:MAG: carbon-nitrogen hydrolase family protein [Anaerolineae bacterium]|nr:carbon-nitrogen hydrolase family protein [Anaerolineae bacterium]